MTPTLDSPPWLHDFGLVELSLSTSALVAGGHLTYSINVTPAPSAPLSVFLELTKNGAVAMRWPTIAPTEGGVLTVPKELPPYLYELIVTCDGWDLDGLPLRIDGSDGRKETTIIESALNLSDKYMQALDEGQLQSANNYARAAAADFCAIKSFGTAARLLRESASALLSRGEPLLAAASALEAQALYRALDDAQGELSATRVLTSAIETSQIGSVRRASHNPSDSRPLLQVPPALTNVTRPRTPIVRIGLRSHVGSCYYVPTQPSSDSTLLKEYRRFEK